MKRLLPIFITFLFAHSLVAQELYKTIDNAHAESANAATITSDGATILTGGDDKRAYLWNTKEGSKIKILSHGDAVTAVAYNASNSKYATACADKRVIVFSAKENKPIKILKGSEAALTAIAINPVDERVAAGNENGEIRVWDKDGGLINTFTDHSKAITALDFSPDGKTLASVSEDNTLKLFNESGQLQQDVKIESKGLYSVTFSADNLLLAVGGNNYTALHDAQSGSIVAKLDGLKGDVKALAFSPDVQYLAGGSDKIVFWKVETRQVENEVKAHPKGVTALAFSDKDNYLVSTGSAGELKIWNTRKLKIGKKAAVSSGGEAAAKLVCSAPDLMDKNENGIIDAGESAKIKFNVKNTGKGTAYDLVAVVSTEDYVKGLEFEKEVMIGSLESFTDKDVEIPISASEELEAAASTFIITVKEGNGNDAQPIRASFQSGGISNYNYIMVLAHEFNSATGKAEIGAPITLTLTLKNVANVQANNIKVNYLLPDGVKAVDRLSERIKEMKPEEEKQVSMQFYADKGYDKKKINIGLDLDGVAFSNAEELFLTVSMSEELTGKEEYEGAEERAEQAISEMRGGGGDPLKGLNVTKAKDMVIGKYYALIIGVNDYSGSWTPLKNAVSDAKAVSTLIQTKYKFDNVKTLYNNQATRANIIQQLEWIEANARPQDNVFIYYSGHGEYNQSQQKGYWVPYDAKTKSAANYIPNSSLKAHLNGIKSKHTLLVSDACFSGDIFRGNTVSVPFEESERYYREVHNLISRQALTSGGIEPVMDGGRDGHSVFTYYFLKTLQNNDKKYLDVGQVYNKIKIPVINNSEQTPKLAAVKNTGDEGGQFIFIKK